MFTNTNIGSLHKEKKKSKSSILTNTFDSNIYLITV